MRGWDPVSALVWIIVLIIMVVLLVYVVNHLLA